MYNLWIKWQNVLRGIKENKEWEDIFYWLETITNIKNSIISKSIKVWMVVAVQSLSHVQLFITPGTATHHASLSFTISWSLLKFMSIESVTLCNHLILCRPLLLLLSIFSSIRVFPNELALHIRWPKYWSCSFSISLSNEYSGLIFFSIDWFDLLVVQGTLTSVYDYCKN